MNNQINANKSDAFVISQAGVNPRAFKTRNCASNMKGGTTQIHIQNRRTGYIPNYKKKDFDLIPKYDNTKIKWATPAPNATV